MDGLDIIVACRNLYKLGKSVHDIVEYIKMQCNLQDIDPRIIVIPFRDAAARGDIPDLTIGDLKNINIEISKILKNAAEEI